MKHTHLTLIESERRLLLDLLSSTAVNDLMAKQSSGWDIELAHLCARLALEETGRPDGQGSADVPKWALRILLGRTGEPAPLSDTAAATTAARALAKARRAGVKDGQALLDKVGARKHTPAARARIAAAARRQAKRRKRGPGGTFAAAKVAPRNTLEGGQDYAGEQ